MQLESLLKFATINAGELLKVYQYLKHYGYLDAGFTLVEAIITAKKLLGTSATTEEIDQAFLTAIETTPRCGLPDFQKASLNGNQWAKSKVANGISFSLLGKLPNIDFEGIIVKSFENWERVCGIKFKYLQAGPGDADILINVSNAKKDEFGTPGNVLAWSYMPQGPNSTQQLLMKYDLAENWESQILLENVATHEIGHAIGLDHTNINNQLLNPIYNRAISKPQAAYDIKETVAKYGPPGTSVPVPPTVPVPTPNPIVTIGIDVAKDTTFLINGQTFVVKGK